MLNAKEALSRMLEGNASYVENGTFTGDIAEGVRINTLKDGQHPYAVVIACSDSRVIPEAIFDAGIGELFVIRVAGNVIDPHQLGSIDYAVDHLGCKLVMVLGHDHCGAVDAAINHDPDGHIKSITEDILEAIGDVTDEVEACKLNAIHTAKKIDDDPFMAHLEEYGVEVVPALYHLDTGEVELL